jgi:hypothetical protein
MHVKAINGVVESYPYSIGNLRKDNPHVSFPKNPTPEMLATWNVYPVEPVGAPSVDRTQDVKEVYPVYNNGWKQTWVVTQATAGEIAERTQAQAERIRSDRDERLVKTDWTQVADAPVDQAAWAAYRQALRDIPQQEGFPWTIDWPNTPE